MSRTTKWLAGLALFLGIVAVMMIGSNETSNKDDVSEELLGFRDAKIEVFNKQKQEISVTAKRAGLGQDNDRINLVDVVATVSLPKFGQATVRSAHLAMSVSSQVLLFGKPLVTIPAERFQLKCQTLKWDVPNQYLVAAGNIEGVWGHNQLFANTLILDGKAGKVTLSEHPLVWINRS